MAKRELLFSVTKKDFEIDTFRSGGPGGQNQNKRDTGVRITHRASGAVGESRTARGQLENKKLAFKRLVDSDKFKKWHRIQVAIALGEHDLIDKKVEESMKPENIMIEVKDESGNWIIDDKRRTATTDSQRPSCC